MNFFEVVSAHIGLAIAAFLGFLVLGFLAVILIRTANFRPKKQVVSEVAPVAVDLDRATDCLAQLVRCKTVSYRDKSKEDDAEFEKLIALLPTLYPNVARVCELKRFPDRGILYRWRGKSAAEPAVLMAHYDVVPAEAEAWEKPPFAGILENGVLWGRGTLDTKVTMNAALFAADTLIGEGFVPEHDVYFAFSGGEEINGKGALHIVEHFAAEGITPYLVLDEGGGVVADVFPGVTKPCGMIGIAEKGMLNVEYRVRTGGGHASAPKPHTPVGVLSAACCRVEKHPFQRHLTPPVQLMFDALGRHSTFLYRMIFANLWCFGWVLDIFCRKNGGDLNAMMRTTVAFTQMQGSEAANVLPPTATMVSNSRLNHMDTMESAYAYIKKTVNDESVTVTVLDGMEPSRISVTDCEAYEKVRRAVENTWQGALTTPYLMMQFSDSRHWGKISDKVYRFSAMDLTAAERATIHGNNERIRVEAIGRATEFYLRLIKTL